MSRKIAWFAAILSAALTLCVSAETLEDAIASGDVERVSVIARSSPDLLDLPNKDGLTPLDLAVQKGSLEVVKSLLAAGAKVDGPAPHGQTALFLAVAAGFPKITAELLSNHAKPD